ncbi:hypothetical protein N7468_005078 [Penicillium chermesinum]|uniref:Uncharacterized protein n=1 Tax=Penicillium chermesinum TaxID=63820 RepID=A0A9W9P0W8_9EURO|nr:uncharacterized protein N7468_005078 [Penicillium chermesinum]KAJ5232122.1 hypothetical protein N7468_005078 [Penicillium chermesinum]
MQAHLPEPVWMPAGQSHGPQVPRVWKLASNCASVGLLLGYLMLAVVFGGSSDDLHINAAAAAVVAYGFIGISYAVSVGISFCQRSAQGFLLRPYLIINLIALFNVVFNIIARDLRPLNAARVIAIGLPATGVLVYGLVAFLIYRELEPEGSHLPDEGSSSMLLLDDVESQRQHFARLLETRDAPAPSPELVQNTYRLDLPIVERTPDDQV